MTQLAPDPLPPLVNPNRPPVGFDPTGGPDYPGYGNPAGGPDYPGYGGPPAAKPPVVAEPPGPVVEPPVGGGVAGAVTDVSIAIVAIQVSAEAGDATGQIAGTKPNSPNIFLPLRPDPTGQRPFRPDPGWPGAILNWTPGGWMYRPIINSIFPPPPPPPKPPPWGVFPLPNLTPPSLDGPPVSVDQWWNVPGSLTGMPTMFRTRPTLPKG